MHIIYDIKSKIAFELDGFGFDSSSWQLNLSTAQNVFSEFRPGWWQFCWMTGVKFNSIQSILVRFLHITQFTVCAAKNLTVFVADSPRCLEWSSMVVAVSRALRELSEPCLGWTREPRRQPKSLGALRQYSQATGNNVLPVMTGSPAFLTRPPPVEVAPPKWPYPKRTARVPVQYERWVNTGNGSLVNWRKGGNLADKNGIDFATCGLNLYK